MTDITPQEAKIIKQVEYYFGDINLSRDKFMKQVISENDGWITWDTMLKFNRLKTLTEDADVLKAALEKSTSGLLEYGSGGIRRCSGKGVESFDEICSKFKDRSLYVKGFNADTSLDEIIEWLEEHGGKTLNVYMRRHPKDKKFKGSVFVVFEMKETAEKLINTTPLPTFKTTPTTVLYREDYVKQKESERDSKKNARSKKQLEQEASKDAQVAARMAVGALLEISGLPDNKEPQESKSKDQGEGEDQPDGEKAADDEAADKNGISKSENGGDKVQGLTVMLLKQWLTEKLGTSLAIAWVDVEPAEGKAIVRFKTANSAEEAWNKLKETFGEEPVTYRESVLSGRVLSGDEEKSRWRTILDAQLQKAQKRRSTGRQGGRGGRGGGGGNKRRRMH